MMKKWTVGLLAATVLLASGYRAHALGGAAIGAKIGTLGPGLEMTGYITDEFNVRAGFNFIDLTVNTSSSGVYYNMDVHFETLAALVDYHPFDNNFRVTGGVIWDDNVVKLHGEPNATATIGNNVYTAEQIGTLTGQATFGSVAPYVGVGFGNAVADDVDLTFSCDLGVMIQDNPAVTLTANGTSAQDPQFQADLKDQENKAQNIADYFKIYPVLSIGMAYYFW